MIHNASSMDARLATHCVCKESQRSRSPDHKSKQEEDQAKYQECRWMASEYHIRSEEDHATAGLNYHK